MKTLTSGFVADLQSDTQTFNTCIAITRADGQAFYFTDCDQPIVFGGNTYLSVDGYTPTQMQSSADFTVDHVEVVAYLQSAAISEADLMAGKWDDAAVQMFMVNRKNLAHGAYQMRYGMLGQIHVTSPGQYQAELRGLTQWVQKQIGSLIMPSCRWTLGDINSAGAVPNSHCTVNLPALAVTGVAVTSVTSNQAFHASSLGQADGYFTSGFLTWTSGLNNGRSADVQASALSGGSIVLQLPMLNNIQIGDLFTIYPGCQKRKLADCLNKFNNVINFGGFAEMPGIDSMIRPGGV
jgi:uncharacterized phage protein (TIGR02218 family)